MYRLIFFLSLVSVSFLATEIKHSDKSHLREKGILSQFKGVIHYGAELKVVRS